MPIPILISPDNRLLGWSLTDLTLYGTQPVPGMVVGRVGDATLPDDTSTAATPSHGSAVPSDGAGTTDAPVAFDDGSQTAAPVTPIAAVPAPAAHEAAPAAPGFEPAVPQPVGGGSFVQAPIVTPLQAADAAHGAPGHATAPDVAPASITDLAPLHDTGLIDGAAGLPGAVLGLADGAPALAANLVEDVAGSPGLGLAADTLGALGTVANGLPGLVSAAADTATSAVAPLTDTGALDALTLDGVTGANPAAGITTLVGMVESGDAFHIGPLTQAPAADAQPSILDALAADALPSPLLGDGHHDGDGGDHLVDGHGIHVGL